MSDRTGWRSIVASALGWEQAHVKLEKALDGLDPASRGIRPAGAPHSIWELLEHIRLTQRDLLEFCRNPHYEEPKWPDDYWPPSPVPANDAAWKGSLDGVLQDRAAFERWTVETDLDLTTRIPHGSGQTYLRTVLVSVDHTSYHVGQIVLVRRLLGAWG